MKWEELTKSVYYRDGALRDMFVFETSRADWLTWAAFVNEKYPVTYTYYDTDQVKSAIDMLNVFAVWDGTSDEYVHASIQVGNCIVKCYFFAEDELENDITPREIREESDHKQLMHYMLEVAELLDKPFVMTPEMTPDVTLLKVVKGQVLYTSPY